jgi:probable HAF family extracellular repeat protein
MRRAAPARSVSTREVPMRHISCAILIAAVLGCGDEPRVTQPQDLRAQVTPDLRYDVVNLATLGGTRARPSGINNLGWLAGFSNLPGNAIRHATLWRDGAILDLGTLGGPHSSVQWPGLNNSGMIVGIAETAADDPLDEAWSCTAFFPTATGRICLGFFWENGVMTALPTLGGTQGFAASVNNRGQVVGWAETTVHDPTCNAPQVLQFRAVLWEPKRGLRRQLRPLPGDSTSAATAINELGTATGISGDCDIAVGQLSARHAVLWERDTVIDIGNLGGDAWHTPMDINERGDVVGFSNPPSVEGIDFAPLAFLWTRSGGMQSLGALDGDTTSQAVGINDRGQVVGLSCGLSVGCRAFLWQDGVMRDLNDLVAPGYSDFLLVAQHINDLGVITGRAVPQGTTRQVPFIATPVPASP